MLEDGDESRSVVICGEEFVVAIIWGGAGLEEEDWGWHFGGEGWSWGWT